jgi:hypothetical protein
MAPGGESTRGGLGGGSVAMTIGSDETARLVLADLLCESDCEGQQKWGRFLCLEQTDSIARVPRHQSPIRVLDTHLTPHTPLP